jgi:hypothetical protein
MPSGGVERQRQKVRVEEQDRGKVRDGEELLDGGAKLREASFE